jgi:argininosuccinate lyase
MKNNSSRKIIKSKVTFLLLITLVSVNINSNLSAKQGFYNQKGDVIANSSKDFIERIDKIHEVGYDDWITAAWATMLMKQGIVPSNDASKAAQVILNMLKEPDTERISGWDYFMKTQEFFNQELGKDIGGNLMVVRTTPPARQTVYIRSFLLKRMCQIYDMQLSFLELAEEHIETVMPGYTHERHAQPLTFGHYLVSVFDAIQRSMETVELGYQQMNLNEMGAGALSGTSWPIDRNLVSEYLGMEGLIENTNDAVSYTDGYLVVVSGLTNITNVLSRVALEFTYWSGEEYGFLEIGNKGTSFLMPQKSNNPNGMEILQLKAGQMTGHLMATAVAGLRVPHGDSHHMLNLEGPTKEALTTAEHCILNMTSEINKLQINEERMLELIQESYIASTELANQLVRDYKIDYRTAHEIVNKFVLTSEEKSITATKAKAELLDNAANEVIGEKLGMTDERLRELLDPKHFIEMTNCVGGVAPQEVNRMITDRFQKLDGYKEKLEEKIRFLEKAQEKLISDLRSFN